MGHPAGLLDRREPRPVLRMPRGPQREPQAVTSRTFQATTASAILHSNGGLRLSRTIHLLTWIPPAKLRTTLFES